MKKLVLKLVEYTIAKLHVIRTWAMTTKKADTAPVEKDFMSVLAEEVPAYPEKVKREHKEYAYMLVSKEPYDPYAEVRDDEELPCDMAFEKSTCKREFVPIKAQPEKPKNNMVSPVEVVKSKRKSSVEKKIEKNNQ